MLQRQSLRKTIHKIRGMLREGNLAGLEPVEQKLAQIVMDHPEYQEQFEDKGLLDGRDIPSDGVNPFLHISMHQMIEDQLAAESPIEAILLCEYLEMAGNSRHEAVHAVMMVLSHTIYHSYKKQAARSTLSAINACCQNAGKSSLRKFGAFWKGNQQAVDRRTVGPCMMQTDPRPERKKVMNRYRIDIEIFEGNGGELIKKDGRIVCPGYA